MRIKLARPAQSGPPRKRPSRHRAAHLKTWAWGLLLLALLVALSALFTARGRVAGPEPGPRPVVPLSDPEPELSTDEQALYWTYALYDMQGFRARFGVAPRIAVNTAEARANLERLLPDVSPHVRFRIEKYHTGEPGP